ncbi:MAG: GTP-binding protein [Lachnospiraceae bacterium]|nr:GTP-binding protein [Lachnospiraceae bacterium]
MTKIDIISGFLGAGKTTLIKKLLADAFKGEKVVLIENEFGEIGIDGGFLKDAGVEITEMNSGCICCSLVGDFGEALQKVLDQFHPDRIIIEPSGVGKLSDVSKAVQNVESKLEGAELNSFSAVVDANKAKVYMKNFGEFFNNQVETAKAIILSRTQYLTDEKLEAVVAMLKEHNASATIITTPWDSLDAGTVLAAMEKKESFADELLKELKEHHDDDECDDPDCECHHHHDHDHEHEHHHHHDHEEHHHHHHDHDDDDDDDECDDPDCECHHHHDHDHEHEHHHDHEHEHEHHHDHDHEHEHHHHHHHHADEVFTSWGKETPHKYDKAELEEILKKLANTEEFGKVLRAKGMVMGMDGTWIYFDLVPEEYEIRTGIPETTGKLCVIGSDINEDKLNEVFR